MRLFRGGDLKRTAWQILLMGLFSKITFEYLGWKRIWRPKEV